MKFTNRDIQSVARKQLAVDLNCSPEDFAGTGFVFCPAADHPGRRPFPRGESHFEMLTFGQSVVVSATPDLLRTAREQLEGKTRDDAFAMPFVHGQGLYFLPDVEKLRELPAAEGFQLEVVERADIPSLYRYEGFAYAIQHDVNHPRPDALAVVARQGETVAGIAGCSDDCAHMWQIGIDVLPEYRRYGLAAALVSRLALETLQRGYVPYYGTSTCNIPSQRVAFKVGFAPAWTCVFRGRFGEALTQPTG